MTEIHFGYAVPVKLVKIVSFDCTADGYDDQDLLVRFPDFPENNCTAWVIEFLINLSCQ